MTFSLSFKQNTLLTSIQASLTRSNRTTNRYNNLQTGFSYNKSFTILKCSRQIFLLDHIVLQIIHINNQSILCRSNTQGANITEITSKFTISKSSLYICIQHNHLHIQKLMTKHSIKIYGIFTQYKRDYRVTVQTDTRFPFLPLQNDHPDRSKY